MPDITFDFGNADIKATDGAKNIHFRHAIAPLTTNDWTRIVGRSGQPPAGYILVEGQPFAMGDKARRHSAKEPKRGAERYVQDYYGVALCYAISELLPPGTRIVNLFASHAPRDIDYTDKIVEASYGKWNFVTAKGEYQVNVKTVNTFDEPLGGYSHFVLTSDGKEAKNNPIRNKTILTIDVGGFTIDVAPIDKGGQIDESGIDSTTDGAIAMFKYFEKEMRAHHKHIFMSARNLDPIRIEDALATGIYKAGNHELNCHDIASESRMMLVSQTLDVLNANGGWQNYDACLLTGGAPAIILDDLKEQMPDIDFILAEKNRDMMRYANVMGGAKWFTMLKKAGALK